MELSPQVEERLRALIASDEVVLFMKGTRVAPQCGFSAATVDILDRYLPRYTTVDVLADPDVREGIKVVSSWPTIPQLYVEGEFVGGADIVRELEQSGELVETLGERAAPMTKVDLTITPAAVSAVKAAMADAGDDDLLRLAIDARFYNDLSIGPRQAGDILGESNGLTIAFDPASARRAQGLSIDYVENQDGAGFKIDNPNAPPAVRELSVEDLKQKMDAGEEFELIDVRTADEAKLARIEGARLLDDDAMRELESLPRDTPLVFHCHHGSRSARAAQAFVDMGFSEVYNVVGGIEAWSQRVDSSVPRY